MLRTVEATFDPWSGVHFMEPIHIDKRVRVLVTILDSDEPAAQTDAGNALLEWLDTAPAPVTARSPEEMESYIRELRASWRD